MRVVLTALAALALAGAIGLGATWWTVANGLPASGLVMGPWRAEPGVGTVAADPYQRAGAARRGEAPLAHGDGLAFTARTDDAGLPLVANCDYELDGDMPAARLWTLAAFDPSGRRLGAASQEGGLTSAQIVRIAGAPFRLALSGQAKPGAWARLAGQGPFVLRLSLYDTVLGTPLDRSDRTRLLSIRRGACR